MLSHLLTASRAPLRNLLQILHQKLDYQVESKVGSLANVKHRPGGGDKQVFNDVEYLRQASAGHAVSVSQPSSRRQSASQVRIETVSLQSVG